MKWRAIFFVAAPIATTTGCLLLRDVDSLSDGVSGFDAAEAALPPSVDAAADAPASACPGNAGPAGARIGDASDAPCIDATEVTVADYRTFFNECEGQTCRQPTSCTWNTSFAPGYPLPGADSNALPIRYVDWCDAAAFCLWAGKRLCGASDGTQATTGDYQSVTKSVWYRACSGDDDGLHAYPYGNDYRPLTCNGGDLDAGDIRQVGSLTGCTGAYPGIFNLSGNLREWEDACDDGTTPTDRTCLVRGGAYYDNYGTLACANRQAATVTQQDQAVGFRCCSP